MKTRDINNVLTALRRDRLHGVWLALFVLLLPFLHPIAEANAANRPFASEICTTFGQTGKAALPGLADDCPVCIVANGMLDVNTTSSNFSVVRHPRIVQVADFHKPNDHIAFARANWLQPPGQAPPLEK
jgi:hypothetical protein